MCFELNPQARENLMRLKSLLGKLAAFSALVALALSMALSPPAVAEERDPGHKAGDKGVQDPGRG
jgi:hypothetical protein